MAKDTKSQGSQRPKGPSQTRPPLEIPEDEQRRIIEKMMPGLTTGIKPSDIRHRYQTIKSDVEVEEEESEHSEGDEASDVAPEDVDYHFSPLWERVFDVAFWLMPFMGLYVVLDLAIHKQYAQPLTLSQAGERLMTFSICMTLVIYFTVRYASHPVTKIYLFSQSLIGGSYMVHLVNTGSYLKVMRRCPPLGALWIWSIVQLDLLPAIVSLVGVGSWVWYKGLTLLS